MSSECGTKVILTEQEKELRSELLRLFSEAEALEEFAKIAYLPTAEFVINFKQPSLHKQHVLELAIKGNIECVINFFMQNADLKIYDTEELWKCAVMSSGFSRSFAMTSLKDKGIKVPRHLANYYACNAKEFELWTIMLLLEIKCSFTESCYGSTALGTFVQKQEKDIVEYLIENGVDIEKDECGGLIYLCIKAYERKGDSSDEAFRTTQQLVKLLFDHGAFVTLSNAFGRKITL